MSNKESSIANKAAEEGKLPALPEEDLWLHPTKYFNAKQMREYARQAIAVDRAARPSVSIESLKRFDFEVEDGQKYNVGNPDGKWVKFADVEALLSFDRAARAGASGDARDAALDEAIAACEAIHSDRRDAYKGRGKYAPNNPDRADSHCDGEGDGALACAEAVEALKGRPAISHSGEGHG